MHYAIKVGSRIVITIWMEYSYTQAYATIPTRESPRISSRCILAAHNQKQLILWVIWRIHIVFSAVAITMERFPHLCTNPYMSREAACINCYRCTYANTLTHVILSCYTLNTTTFHNRCFNCVTHMYRCASTDGTAR